MVRHSSIRHFNISSLFETFLEAERGTVAAGSPKHLVGWHGMCLKSEHLARAGENRVPRHFEVSAFEAIGSARRNRGSGWFLIAHALIIAAKGMIVTVRGIRDRGKRKENREQREDSGQQLCSLLFFICYLLILPVLKTLPKTGIFICSRSANEVG